MQRTRTFLLSMACLCLLMLVQNGVAPAYGADVATFAAIPLQGSTQDCKLAGGCAQEFATTLADLNSEFILVEVFSMYCPICQGAAPSVNALYQLIQKSPFASRMLLIGAGADNSRYEVDFFRKKYAVPFGLFADPGLAFYNGCGANGTPYFLLLHKTDSGQLKLLYTHSGKFDDPETFFNTLLQKADLAD